MSYSTLLGVLKDGTIETIEEYRNGHGAGPYVWRILFGVRRGLRAYDHPAKGYMDPEGGYISSGFIPKCTDEEAWVLGMTFDCCIVSRESAPAAAKHLRTLLEGPGQPPDHVNHWPKILAVLEDMPEKYTGVAINHTSVGDCALLEEIVVERDADDDADEDEDEDEDEDDLRPYNINVDKAHFFLTEECIQGWKSGEP